MSRDVLGLTEFATSIAAYEARMRAALGDELDKDGLDAKHEALDDDAFKFLRGTCWRWAEAAPILCPGLMNAPRAPSVGDAHAENFGIWRDAQSRLVWGINDYDEAAYLPWCLDLVRLCTSIALAIPEWKTGAIAGHALEGYQAALRNPAPIVLELEHLWMRDAFAASDKKRIEFWKKLEKEDPAEELPDDLLAALLSAAPAPGLSHRITPREAGVGSLGRPRFVAVYRHRGAPVAFEVKRRLPSCWGGISPPDLAQRMASGPRRSPDPFLHYAEHHVLRRLAPDSQKLDLREARGVDLRELIAVMGAELATVHAESRGLADAILEDSERRDDNWLKDATRTVADWTEDEHAEYKNG